MSHEITLQDDQSKNIGYIPALHHLRCLAALLVFAHHYLHYYLFHWTPQPGLYWLGFVLEGYTGVGLFFALSGFLFTNIILQSGKDIVYWSFVKNRVLRIFPLYVFVFVLAISLKPENLHGANIFDFLISNLGSPVSSSFITGAAWTISIEFAFYMIFPFLIKFHRIDGDRYLLRLIALIFVTKIAIFLFSERANFSLYISLIGRMDQFLIGMLAAVSAQRGRAWLERNGRWLLIMAAGATFAALAALARYASIFGAPRHLVWLFWPSLEAILWSAVIVAYVAKPVAWPDWLESKLRRGGEISYSLYMLHLLVIYILFQTIGMLPYTGSLVLDLALNAVPVLILTWILAGTSFAVIERPFLRMRVRYLSGQ